MRFLFWVCVALLFVPGGAGATTWETSEVTGSLDDAGNFEINFHVRQGTYWSNIAGRAYVRIRECELALPTAVASFERYVIADSIPSGVSHDPQTTTVGDSIHVQITGSIETGIPHRFVSEDGLSVKMQVQALVGVSRTSYLTRSPWIAFDADFTGVYSPAASVTVADSCGFAGLFYYLKVEQQGLWNVKTEWYDDVDDTWRVLVPPVGEDFSPVAIKGPSTTLQYDFISNDFSYIGARTDGSTRVTLLSLCSGLEETIAGPNILGFCGFENDITPPTVESQTSGYSTLSGGFYFISVSASEACISRARYRTDGGTWSAWSDWTTTYQPNHQFTYARAVQDQTVDFEMEIEDKAGLPYAGNPVSETVFALGGGPDTTPPDTTGTFVSVAFDTTTTSDIGIDVSVDGDEVVRAFIQWKNGAGGTWAPADTTGNWAGPSAAQIDVSLATGTATSAAADDTFYVRYSLADMEETPNESAFVGPIKKVFTREDAGDVTPPDAPTGLVAFPSPGSILLTWSANGEGDLAATPYTIYSSSTSGSGYTLAGTSATTFFNDTGLGSEETVYYVVTAKDTSDNESGYSTEVNATTDDTQAPAVPTGLIATAGDNEVDLDWDDNGEPDFNSYRIYRGVTTGSTTLYKGGVAVSEWTDANAANDSTYYYQVAAQDDDNNVSSKSSEVNATPAEPGVGDFYEGVSFVISGSGFGTKPTASSLVWEDFESGSSGATVSTAGGWDSVDGAGGATRPSYTDSLAAFGDQSSKLDFIPEWNQSFLLYDDLNTVYIDGWVQYREPWDSCISRVRKLFIWGHNPLVSYPEVHLGTSDYKTRNPEFHVAGYKGSGSPSDQAGVFDTSELKGSFHHLQAELKLNTGGGANGVCRVWLDGVLVSNSTSFIYSDNGDNDFTDGLLAFGYYHAEDNLEDPAPGGDLGCGTDVPCATCGLSTSPMYFWDNIYVDNTMMRVMLADNATWGSHTKSAPQIITAWSSSEISITGNIAGFDDENAWLHVLDEDGSSVHVESVTVGLPGPDTTPPDTTGTFVSADFDSTDQDDIGIDLSVDGSEVVRAFGQWKNGAGGTWAPADTTSNWSLPSAAQIDFAFATGEDTITAVGDTFYVRYDLADMEDPPNVSSFVGPIKKVFERADEGGGGGIVVTNLTTGFSNSEDPSTASITPAAGAQVILSVGISHTSLLLDELSVAGGGATWTKVATAPWADRRRGYVWIGSGFTGSDTIDLSFISTTTQYVWNVDQVTGLDAATPYDGVDSDNTGGTSVTVTSAASPSAGDIYYSMCQLEAALPAMDSDFEVTTSTNTGGDHGVRQMETTYTTDQDQSAAWTWGGVAEGFFAVVFRLIAE